MASEAFLQEEFWWLSALGLAVQGRVGVALSNWTHPLQSPQFELISGHRDIGSIVDWAAGHQWEGVHRTLEVFGVPNSEEPVVGPIVIDIDAGEDYFDDGGTPTDDLVESARGLTFDVLGYLEGSGVPERHRRVYFSGHKGFHVHYVLPSRPRIHLRKALDDFSPRHDTWRSEMRRIREAVGATGRSRVMIDNVHDYVRLRGSVNRWGPSGSERRHRVVLVQENELASIPVDELWECSRSGPR